MASIWKELMFLQGHFVRPADLLEDTAAAVAASAPPARPDTGACRDAVPDTAALVCSG